MDYPIRILRQRGAPLGIAIAVALAALGTMGFVSPVAASDVHVNLNLGWHGGYGYPRAHHKRYGRHHRPYLHKRHHGGRHHHYRNRHHHYRSRHHHHRHHGRHHYRKHYPKYYNHSDGRYGYRNYSSYGSRPCHPVYKEGYWHGRPAKVGGTMCYNRYGEGYVASGSRYLIHYY